VSGLAGITPEQALKTIEVPKKDGYADLCVCVPKINQFNKLKGAPPTFAQKWAEQVGAFFPFLQWVTTSKFTPNELLLKASCVGPYLNFDINKTIMAKDLLPVVFEMKDKWGHSKVGDGKTVVVEFR
jgi:arginyl-tRNA synthetase